MSKYIDAERLKTDLTKWRDIVGNFYDESPSLAECLKIVDMQPTHHGRWIKNDGRYGWHCSVCGEDDLYAFAWNSDTGENELQDRYCPNCGSRMDLDGDTE